jgi:tRNA(fMet)-specific endonuclease VapC
MKYLLDTNAISVWATRRSPQFLKKVTQINPTEMGICSIVKMELLYGLELRPSLKWSTSVRGLIAHFQVLAFDEQSANHAAKIRAKLKLQGTPIGHYDVLIAATALANGMVLVTNNTREFSRVEGLMVEDWQTGLSE